MHLVALAVIILLSLVGAQSTISTNNGILGNQQVQSIDKNSTQVLPTENSKLDTIKLTTVDEKDDTSENVDKKNVGEENVGEENEDEEKGNSHGFLGFLSDSVKGVISLVNNLFPGDKKPKDDDDGTRIVGGMSAMNFKPVHSKFRMRIPT